MIPAQHGYRSPRASSVFKRDTDKGWGLAVIICYAVLTIWLLLSCKPLTPVAAYLLSVPLGCVGAEKWLVSRSFAISFPLTTDIRLSARGVLPSRQNNKRVGEGKECTA